MFRLALILFGADALIKRWKIFFTAGLITLTTGVLVLADLGDGVANVASWVLGAILLVQGVLEAAVGATHTGQRRRFQMLRGATMVVSAALILDFPWDNSLSTSLLLGFAFTFNGLLRIASSWLIRYRNWRLSNLKGWGYLLIAVLLLSEWPLRSDLNLSFCVGLALLAAAFVLIRGAWRLRWLPAGSRLAAVDIYHPDKSLADRLEPSAPSHGPTSHHTMVVHIWTAAYQMPERIRLPLIDRYIFAMSRKGSVSTGHIALEAGHHLYISHHPRVRLNITQENVLHQMQATELNDHPGMWLPSYHEEAAATRPSTFRVRFRVFNQAYLESFWAAYQQEDTYNLTYRNCAVSVTQAVDAAVEGVFADKPFWRTLLRLLFHPDMWAAGGIRVRAESMAWTPGLALDYVSAIRRLTDPRQNLKLHLARWLKSRRRRRTTPTA